MSELSPRSARVGDRYRTALGLRLLPVGSVIRSGPLTRLCHFRKVDVDAWAYANAAGDLVSAPGGHDIGTTRLPFRSEQIWLPVTLVAIGEQPSRPVMRARSLS